MGTGVLTGGSSHPVLTTLNRPPRHGAILRCGRTRRSAVTEGSCESRGVNAQRRLQIGDLAAFGGGGGESGGGWGGKLKEGGRENFFF